MLAKIVFFIKANKNECFFCVKYLNHEWLGLWSMEFLTADICMTNFSTSLTDNVYLPSENFISQI